MFSLGQLHLYVLTIELCYHHKVHIQGNAINKNTNIKGTKNIGEQLHYTQRHDSYTHNVIL